MAAKKNRKTQASTARLIFLICAIALTIGAFHLAQTGLTVLQTQGKLVSYYCSIQKANDQHDYCYDEALSYPLSGYMKQAEEWDKKAESLTKERADFVANATDPVVVWASRDGVEFLTILAGLLEFVVGMVLSLIGCWYLILAFVSKYVIPKHRKATPQVPAKRPRPYHARNNRVPYRTK